MKRGLAFAAVAVLAALGFGRVARAQEFPWLFAGGSDIAAIVDQDGDGPDLTDDCYFKFTGNPALSASMTFLYVDASGMTCHEPFPCTGSFVVNPGGDTTITLDSCMGFVSVPTPFTTTFSRPGPPVTTNALVSPNMGSTNDSDPPVSALFCSSQGELVAQVKIANIIAVLLPLSFYPSAADPDFLKVPFLGEFIDGTGDVFIPLTGKRATVASSTAPQTTVGEVDFGNVCDCSLGGLCPSTVSPAPAANGWGLAIAAFGLLVIGAWALRRKPRFAGDLPLP